MTIHIFRNEHSERVGREKLILTTPNGFWPQGSLMGAESEVHRSTWNVEDFKKRGYTIHGYGLKYNSIFAKVPPLLIAIKEVSHSN